GAGIGAENVAVGQLPGEYAQRLGEQAAGCIEERVGIRRAGSPRNGVAGVIGEVRIIRYARNRNWNPVGWEEEITAEGIGEKEVHRNIGECQEDVIAGSGGVIDAETIAAGVEAGIFGQAREGAGDGVITVVVDDDELLAHVRRAGEDRGDME